MTERFIGQFATSGSPFGPPFSLVVTIYLHIAESDHKHQLPNSYSDIDIFLVALTLYFKVTLYRRYTFVWGNYNKRFE